MTTTCLSEKRPRKRSAMSTQKPPQTRSSNRCSIDLERGLPGDVSAKGKKSPIVLTLQNCKRILYAAGAIILLITVLGYGGSHVRRRLGRKAELEKATKEISELKRQLKLVTDAKAAPRQLYVSETNKSMPVEMPEPEPAELGTEIETGNAFTWHISPHAWKSISQLEADLKNLKRADFDDEKAFEAEKAALLEVYDAKRLTDGTNFDLPMIEVDGLHWYLKFFPNGQTDENKFSALYLYCDEYGSGRTGGTTVLGDITVFLENPDSTKTPIKMKALSHSAEHEKCFSNACMSWGWHKLVETSLIEGKSLMLRLVMKVTGHPELKHHNDVQPHGNGACTFTWTVDENDIAKIEEQSRLLAEKKKEQEAQLQEAIKEFKLNIWSQKEVPYQARLEQYRALIQKAKATAADENLKYTFNVTSQIIEHEGFKWYLSFYPKGQSGEDAAELYLYCVDFHIGTEREDYVEAAATLLVSGAGLIEPSKQPWDGEEMKKFRAGHGSWGWQKYGFIKKPEDTDIRDVGTLHFELHLKVHEKSRVGKPKSM